MTEIKTKKITPTLTLSIWTNEGAGFAAEAPPKVRNLHLRNASQLLHDHAIYLLNTITYLNLP
jgi:hypothetical protein